MLLLRGVACARMTLRGSIVWNDPCGAVPAAWARGTAVGLIWPSLKLQAESGNENAHVQRLYAIVLMFGTGTNMQVCCLKVCLPV